MSSSNIFSLLTGGLLLEAGISEKNDEKILPIFRPRLGDGHLLEHGHLLE